MTDLPISLILSLIVAVACLCQWIAWQIKIPAILPLLIVGVILGPVSGIIVPDEVFGDLLFPVISLSVAVILFEGSLTLKFKEIRETAKVVQNLTSIGMLITWAIMSVAAHIIFGFCCVLTQI